MRNLKVIYEQVLELSNLKLPELQDNFNCVVTENDRFYLRIEDKIYCFTTTGELASTIRNNDTDFSNSKLVGFELCKVTRKINIAYPCGRLFTLDTTAHCLRFAKYQYIKQISNSIKSMKFSPDSKILTLITSDNTLTVIKSLNYCVIKEVKLSSLQSARSNKANALLVGDPRADNLSLEISWQRDSNSFVVYFLSKEGKILHIQVYDRTGVLKNTRQFSTTDLGQGNLHWGPSGSAIAATHGFQYNNHMISYFKENSLNHTDISTLPFQPEEILIKDSQWSTDADVLAIWCVNVRDKTSRIQLWTENNTYWYLKQTLLFPAKNPILYLTWGSNLKLHILTKKLLLTYKFIWTVSHSCGTNETDKALVGVIDGDRALLTAFRQSVIPPPPMADQALGIDQPIHEIVFAPDVANKDSWINSNVLFTVLHGNQLAFYKQESEFVEYAYIKSYEIEWEVPKPDRLESIPYSMYNFFWYKEDTILCTLVGVHHRNLLCVIHIDGISPQKNGRLIVKKTHEVNDCIQHIVRSPDTEIVYIITKEVLTYNKDRGIENTKICVINFVADHIEVIEVDNKHIIVCLAENFLYFNGKKIASNITSFFVHARFLLLTTTQNTLINIALDTTDFAQKLTLNSVIKLEKGVGNEKFLSGLSIKTVRNGSRLIMAIPKDTRTILQTGNGKVDSIRPGEQSIIYVIGTYLDELNYRAAFDLITKQRINLNLIFDHYPDLFIANTAKFIGDINDPCLLNLFLSNLQEEDVTSTIYSTSYARKTKGSPSGQYAKASPPSKVKYVCDLLRNHIEARPDANRWLLPIMASLLKKTEIKDLEEALNKVKALKRLESQNKAQQDGSSEEALKYLMHSVDVNTLFDVALGMYDFQLTNLIAVKFQKNSEEYLSLLNTFKSLEDKHYMCFCIDKYLKRYESALYHISKCDDRFVDCIALIESQNLHSKALPLYHIDSKQYKQIAESYGDHLMVVGRYQEAAIMFTRSNYIPAKAFNAYKLAGDFREAISVAEQMKFEDSDLHSLYNEFAKQLKDSKKYGAAAIIFMHTLNKPEDAIAAFCEGKLWEDALRAAHQSKNLEIIETLIKPAVQEYADLMILKISKNQTDLKKYKERAQNLDASISPSEEGNISPNPKRRRMDIVSEISTIKSAIQKIVSTTREDKDEVNSLVRTLLRLYDDTRAEKLRSLLEGLLTEIEASL